VRCGDLLSGACFSHALDRLQNQKACVASFRQFGRAYAYEAPSNQKEESHPQKGLVRLSDVSAINRRCRSFVLGTLIGVIASLAVIQDYPHWRGKGTVVPEPEISAPLSFKSISIFNSSIQINRPRAASYVSYFPGGKGTLVPQGLWHHVARTESSSELLLQDRSDKSVFINGLSNFNSCPANHFISGRLSGIFEIEKYPRNIETWRLRRIEHGAVEDCGIMWGYVRPQLAMAIGDHYENSPYQSEKLSESGSASNASYSIAKIPAREPTIIPLISSVLAAGFGFFFCLFGLLNLDNKRRLWGAALLGCGLLLGGWGFLMWAVPL
jgi:hypothetical protein